MVTRAHKPRNEILEAQYEKGNNKESKKAGINSIVASAI